MSHDQYLIESTVNELWMCEGGAVTPFHGTFEVRRQQRCRAARQQRRRVGERAPALAGAGVRYLGDGLSLRRAPSGASPTPDLLHTLCEPPHASPGTQTKGPPPPARLGCAAPPKEYKARLRKLRK